ncbi:Cdk-activating kinase assembly factor [Parasponia andersonii]|uniref:Cdk-activating kinase assembly factor n=1 Tax=Parasponia andersonii TaxID=3476 RepID=A0A2P5BI45_PARAD|nr:Cdk-activating kinase assembly factor [Parasponia andersonii]
MASSDEEGEIVPNCVTNYHFVNEKGEPVSFTVLPLQWSPNETVVQSERQVFLLASVDDGLQQAYKKVVAWRFDLSYVQPEIYVLSKDRTWIVLQKPRKSFEDTIRAILVTVHWLHFLKKNLSTSRKLVWNYLRTVFGSFEVEPCESDVLANFLLISEAVKRDKDLAKCEDLHTYMEKPSKNIAFHEDVQPSKKSIFIVDMDDDYNDDGDGDRFEGDSGLYVHVCAICDNGGLILCCQGRCMRSFHATEDAGGDCCPSLGYTDAQVKAIPTFFCANCKYQQHQCFVCRSLGSSDSSSTAEVFPCISTTCGHFYHPECVAKLLQPADKSQREELRLSIAAGESFTCPVHKCFVCQQGEDKKVKELQSISFEYNHEKNIMQRAWDGLLPNRVLIYCLDHEIISELGTPVRDHIKFPDVRGQQKTHNLELHSRNERVMMSIKCKPPETFATRKIEANLPKQVEKVGCSVSIGDSTQNIKKRCAGPDFVSLRKPNRNEGERKSSKETIGHYHSFFPKTEGKLLMKNNSISLDRNSIKFKRQIANGIGKRATEEHVIKNTKRPCPSIQAEMENRILDLMKQSTSSFDEEEFIKRQRLQATNGLFSDKLPDKDITSGKVEGSVKAIRTALKKLDEGCRIEDAKAVCEPEILTQIFHWKRKLGVYLAPFLHGNRYTSYGRHFTKVDKIKEILDFCCGANDFSLLMREKLEKIGKRCFFKNYDLFTPKNDFCFEQRDWMSIKIQELPNGSQLIMGLNPPFGVNASLAKRFINKALEFRPKLLILIVPTETKQLNTLTYPYDLLWEDEEILSGKSFYLPGSLDVHEKQLEDWNLKAPPLYLWSRRDWTPRHKEIAEQHGHIFQQKLLVGGNNVNNYVMGKYYDFDQNYYYFYSSGDIPCTLDRVSDVKDEAQPEGAGSSTLDKVKQNYIHHDSIGMGCKNNLNEVEARGQTERLIQGNSEGWTPDDLSVDTEFSSPAISQTLFKALHEAFGTPEMENTVKGCRDKEKSPSGQDFPNDLEHDGIQTAYPTVTERQHSFPSGANLGNYWWHDTDMQFQWYTGVTNHFGQRSYSDGRQFQYYGSSSMPYSYTDYSQTPMMRGSVSGSCTYQPEHPHANETEPCCPIE